jgi:uncharacterized protein YdeI (YjbR/CyaY-like superfamily)
MQKTKKPVRRKRYPLPAFMKEALDRANLMTDYEARPPYQRNDYIGWIMRATQEATKLKRLKQMLDELRKGGVYMKMKHAASAKKK